MGAAQVAQVLDGQLQQAEQLRTVLDRQALLPRQVAALQRLQAVLHRPHIGEADLRGAESHMAEKGGVWDIEEPGAAPKSALPPTHHRLYINSMQGPPVKETVPVGVVESSEAQWFPRVH